MKSIEREILVKRKAIDNPISYTRATNAIPLVFRFCDFTIPEDAEARVYVQKPSGKAVYTQAEVVGNCVTVDVTSQMFVELGRSYLQIQVVSGEKVLVTFMQTVDVLPNYTEGDAEQSKNEDGFFGEYMGKLSEATEEAAQASQRANDAVDLINGKLENGEFIGPVGPAGHAATIRVNTVTTGEPGTPAKVENVGDDSEVILDFTIPQGKTGEIDNIDTVTVDFEEAQKRENIEKTDALSVIFGKIRKVITDISEGALGSLIGRNLEAGKALVSDADGKIASSSVSDIELGYLSGVTKSLQEQINEIKNSSSVSSFDAIYPVGSIYMSVKNTNPSTFFEGTTWVAWGAGKVPVGVNTSETEFDAVEKTGGAKSVNLNHSHTVNGHTHTVNNHRHLVNAHSHTVDSHKHIAPTGYDNNSYYTHDIWGDIVKSAPLTGWAWSPSSNTATNQTRLGYTSEASPGTSESSPYTNYQSPGTSESAPGTDARLSSAVNNLQPYITCYMWKRTK